MTKRIAMCSQKNAAEGRIIPRWGEVALEEVKAIAVEDWLSPLKKPNGKALASGTKKKIRDLMHVLYAHAIRYEWIDQNPISAVRQGGQRLSTPSRLSVDQLSQLIFEVLKPRERVMVLHDFGTGLRRGELSGVKWEDIDFGERKLTPRRSIVKQHVGAVKTEKSKHSIPLDDDLLDELLAWRQETPYAENSDYIFASPKMKGKQPYWMSRIMQHHIKPAASEAGIEIKGWHTLRHSYTTLLWQNLLPKWGSMKLTRMRTIELQDFFNSFSPRLAPKTIRNMHGCMRAVFNQGKTWGLLTANPTQGVRLPRKKARKPPVVLAKQDIRRLIDGLPEPTRSIVTLVIVGSLRIGEVTALRWGRIHLDRIEVVERFYEGEFDDTKTDAGHRSIPLDSFGILRAVFDALWQGSKYRKPEDLVFSNRRGGPVNRRNLLRRQLKPTAKKLGLPATVDFRSFRTMHSSLMSSTGVRPEVTRDNMGHANIDVTQNVYNKTWWEERVEAVSMAAASVWREFMPTPRVPAAM